jgi:hypothetical protein
MEQGTRDEYVLVVIQKSQSFYVSRSIYLSHSVADPAEEQRSVLACAGQPAAAGSGTRVGFHIIPVVQKIISHSCHRNKKPAKMLSHLFLLPLYMTRLCFCLISSVRPVVVRTRDGRRRLMLPDGNTAVRDAEGNTVATNQKGARVLVRADGTRAVLQVWRACVGQR